MLLEIRTKIRALVSDLTKPDFQVFTYGNSNIFPLSEPNASEVTSVLRNGLSLGSGESYTFDAETKEVTISGVSFSVNDIVQIKFNFTKFSDAELNEFIRASLSWLNIFQTRDDNDDYEIEAENNEIYPEITKQESDLVALIASILICPDFTSYRLPNVSITYPDRMPKEERIARLITRFNHGIGVGDVIQII